MTYRVYFWWEADQGTLDDPHRLRFHARCYKYASQKVVVERWAAFGSVYAKMGHPSGIMCRVRETELRTKAHLWRGSTREARQHIDVAYARYRETGKPFDSWA